MIFIQAEYNALNINIVKPIIPSSVYYKLSVKSNKIKEIKNLVYSIFKINLIEHSNWFQWRKLFSKRVLRGDFKVKKDMP